MARSLVAVASLCLVGVAASGYASSPSGPAPTCGPGSMWARPAQPPVPVPQVAPRRRPHQIWDAGRHPVFDYLAETVIIH